MEKIFSVKNLDCAHCGAKIEEAVSKLKGVDSAVLNFPMMTLRVCGEINDKTLELINKTASKIEPGVEIVNHDEKHIHHAHSHEHEHCHDHCECGEHNHTHSHEHSDEENEGRREVVSLVAGVLIFAAALILHKIFHDAIFPLFFFIVAYLILGSNVLKATLKNIKMANFFDENTLMTVATIGAFVLGEYAEAVGVVLFFRIGEMFESFAVARSRKAITDVSSLRVEDADVLADGEFTRVSADSIKVGDIIRIKPGERIAADGIIEKGSSRIDTSAINGEPVPVGVHVGDRVLSGCINLSEVIILRATAAADESMISKIASAVENASAKKPKIDRFITRFAKVYTPVVIAAAVLTAVVPSLITGDWSKWIYSALTFLVISCPCALVLSVPLAYFSGIGAASKLGILFKGGDAIEALGKIKNIAFDKTGTLTDGCFTVTDVEICGNTDENELLKIAGSCETASTHPVAESIVEYCKSSGIALDDPEKAAELAGRGVSAVIGGKSILCGNEKMMTENGISLPEMKNTEIGSVVYVAVDGIAAGRIVVSDKIKKTSAAAVSALKSMGVKTAMLTGDKPENAEIIGKKTGVDSVKGGLLPEGKLDEINRIRSAEGAVMFVGDGINDGPVLAGADVGGAMQTGSDLALEASDVVFMNPEPEAVVKAKRIADRALKISYQNIIFALGVKAAVMILGLLGHPNMWLAVFADSGTAMLLALNSVRILNTKKY